MGLSKRGVHQPGEQTGNTSLALPRGEHALLKDTELYSWYHCLCGKDESRRLPVAWFH